MAKFKAHKLGFICWVKIRCLGKDLYVSTSVMQALLLFNLDFGLGNSR